MSLIVASLAGWILLSAFVSVLVGRCIAMARGLDRSAPVTTNDEATEPAVVGGESASALGSDRPLAALL
jgi:hypothetical protein